MLKDLIASILRDVIEGRLSKAEGLRICRDLKAAAQPETVATPAHAEPIAIIGVAGRYPQAEDLDQFWDNLKAGRDSVTEVPPGRWETAKPHYKWGGFLDDVDRFDAAFFNVSPREAERMDPQERLFLQTAWTAIEDAGYTRRALQGTGPGDLAGNVGVFVGVTYQEYQLYGAEQQARGREIGLAGISAGVANRVSYFCNFHGPSLAVDTMCSSSLTAIHLACQSLRTGECALALAGGVNLSIHPNKYLILSQGQFVSSKGRCESFGAGGDGYVPGEGVGCVLLKPLSKAVADGDRIYGVIRATALNHGGKTNGYTVPNPQAQAAVIRRALLQAGIDPRRVSYLEAHGTGTSLGDPIEITGLSKAYQGAGEGDITAQACAIGSVKSNIGHSEAAAGIAGLTKVLLQMQHRQLVPSLHAERLNPNIDFEKTPFRVQRELSAWEPVETTRIAGISSFGAGGSNAHVIVEEWVEERTGTPAATRAGGVRAHDPVAVVVSAQNQDRLRETVTHLRNHLAGDLEDIAYTLQIGREAMECRVAFVVSSTSELADQLEAWLKQAASARAFFGLGPRDLATRGVPKVKSEVADSLEDALLHRRMTDLASLWAQGTFVDWDRLYAGVRPRRVHLPAYPFDRSTRYWFDSYEPKKIAPPVAKPALSLPVDLSVVSCRLIDGSIAFVKMHDREHRNQMAGAMVEELERVFSAIGSDPRIKVVVLAGYEEVFCLGGTKEALVGISDGTLRYSDVPFVYRGLLDCPVPVIAAMEGHAVGGGLAFGCQADMIYLAEESVYGANFMQYGFTPGMGGTLFFAEKFGSNLAHEMMFTADSLTGKAMKDKGAPVTIKPRADVLGEAMAKARSLAEKPVHALKLLKGTLAKRLLAELPRIVEEELAMHDETITRPEVRQKIEDRIDRMEAIGAQPPAAAPERPAPAPAELSAIQARLRTIVAHLLHMDEHQVRPESVFQDLGIDSIAAVELARDVNTTYGLSLDAVVLYDCPTIDKYARHIAEQLGALQASIDAARSPAPMQEAPPTAIAEPASRSKIVLSHIARPATPAPATASAPVAPVVPTPPSSKGIAVIGMAGRFPGAGDLEEFWLNLTGGVCSVEEVPRARWSLDEVYDPRPMQPNKTYSKWGGFLDGVDRFDPLFFSLSPAEAAQMDPQQRLFLQAAWHAIEDAGYAAEQLAGTSCGVFAGVGQGDYLNVLNAAGQAPAAQSLMGNTCSMLSGRIAYFLDLNGPNMAIDTACSSSLVAIHQGCQSLMSGESDLVLAGGVYVMTTPMMHVMTSRGAMLSPTGQCRAFDQQADGFVLAEGVGVLVLKPLEKAVRDGDHIYGVIRGSGINYDGATNGITAPSAVSQEALETGVYEKSGVRPDTIGMVEAHGTGTKLGDPIEVKALTKAFRKDTARGQYCAIGSVKSNIGHALAAAGVAGAIKTLLCLQRKTLVPTLHYERANEHLELAATPFYVNTRCREWPLEAGASTRLAALSSFGLSGTNAHVVFEEYVAPPLPAGDPDGYQLLTLSAKTSAALRERTADLVAWIGSHGAGARLEDVAFTLNRGRSHFTHRCALVVRSLDEAGASLRAVLDGGRPDHVLCGEQPPADAADRAIYEEVLQHVSDALRGLDRATGEARQKLFALAGLYVKGHEVPWELGLGARQPRRISLPGYPFAQERCWPEPAPQTALDGRAVRLHPLVGVNASDLFEQKFTTVFTGREFYLRDHQVLGRKLLPAVAMLEMARAAAAVAGKQSVLTIRDVVWTRPIAIDGETPAVSIRLRPDRESLRFDISRTASQTDICSTGTIVFGEPNAEAAPTLDLDAIRSRCAGETAGSECYELFSGVGIAYGPAFQSIRTLWWRDGEALARLRRPELPDQDTAGVWLHPSLMDGALQAGLGIVLAAGDSAFAPAVPYALQELVIHDRLTDEVYAHVTRTASGAYDVALADASGRVRVALRGLLSRPIARDTDGVLALTARWAPAPLLSSSGASPARTIVFTPSCRSLAGQLAADGAGVELLALPDERLGVEAGVVDLFAHVQAKLRGGLTGAYQYALLVSAGDDQARVAALTALLKSAVLENPMVQARAIHCRPDESVERVREELGTSAPGVVEVRWTPESGLRETKRFEEAALSLDGVPSPFREGGVYWITGGAGGLGRLTARHISKTKNTKIVLSGRSELKGEQRAALAEIEQSGGEAQYVPCDVASLESVEAALATIRGLYGPLTGIVHSAGVIRDAFILKKDTAQIREVLAPKVTGLLNIARATADDPLDFILLYSAAAGSLGNLGQADYAAANAFLDAAAGGGRCRIVSIGWPLWADGGMKVSPQTAHMMAVANGVKAMPSAVGMQVVDAACASPYAHVLVLYGNREQLRRTLIDRGTQVPVAEAAPTAVGGIGEADVVAYLRSQISVPLGLASERIDPDTSFEEYGVDSVMVLEVTAQLERDWGPLPKTLFFEYATLRALARHFMTAYADRLATVLPRAGAVRGTVNESDSGRDATRALRLPQIEPAAARRTGRVDVAVIGLSGRYPKAGNLDAFWENLKNGIDCITEIPADRWDHARYYDAQKNGAGKVRSKWGGFLDDVDKFDPYFFKISPLEAEIMDPQERLLLEVAWETLEDAGYTRDMEHRPRVGVYVGLMYSEYQLFGAAEQAHGRQIALSGSPASIANRVSYLLNFHGPSMAVDSMCSSSLTAIHLACESLRSGHVEMALAGGVNLSLHPNKYLLLGQGQFVSSTGRCESFGVGGDGYVPAEGVGCVLLKPLERAVADGDHIYGVIRGTALNHGGKTNGYTVPSPTAQQEVIEAALEEAGVSPAAITYLEAHGTGTSLGDPIEIEGLSKAFRGGGSPDHSCAIGSVKSNIGHCESAAGMAGLTKILLQMKHGQLVPSLYSATLNPHIDFSRSPFVVQQTLAPWPGRRLAGLSSFGAGGSNAHLIIEEWGSAPARPQAADDPVLIVLSAKTDAQLRALAANLRRHVMTAAPPLASLAYTLQVGREAMDRRLAFVASTLDAVVVTLGEWLEGRTIPASADAALEAAASEWMAGRTLQWTRLYAGTPPSRVSLPTYPFAKERYWVPRVAESQDTEVPERVIHHELSGTEPWLAGHRVHGETVVPGVAYLDIVLQAASELLPSTPLSLVDVIWIQPLVVARPQTLRVRLKRRGDGFDFDVTSAPGARETAHCRGSVVVSPARPVEDLIDIADLESSLPVVFAGGDNGAFYEGFAHARIDYGPAFRNIRALRADERRSLAWIEAQHASRGEHVLFPPLADAALQAIGGILRHSGAQALPFSLGRLDVRDRLPDAFHALVTRTGDHRYDIALIAADGGVIARMHELELRPGVDPLEGLTFTVDWIHEPLNDGRRGAPGPASEKVLVLGAGHAFGLDESIRSHESEDRIVRQDRGGIPACGKLYFLGGLDDRTGDPLEPGRIEEQYAASTLDWFRTVKRLIEGGFDERNLDIVVLTQQTQAVPGTAVEPGGAGLHGLCQSLAKECTRWNITVIDVDRETLQTRAGQARLLDAIAQEPNQKGFRCLAYRGGRRYVSRVVPVTLPAVRPESIREGGTYVIAGGTGGLGLTVTEALVKQYGAQVIWLGRRPMDDSIREKAAALGRDGRPPMYIQADITDGAAMNSALDRLQRDGHRINGVIHSALVLNDQSLRKMTEEQFQATTSAKIRGGLVLAETFGRAATDWMCFFSSAQSLMGAAGQGNYAAGSSFEDAYAHAITRRVSCSVRTINWGYWGEVGAVATQEYRDRMARQGIGSISRAEGTQAFLRILTGADEQVVVLKASKPETPRLAATPAIGATAAPAATGATGATAYVRQLVAATLKIPVGRLDVATRFEALGVDSILGVVLSDRLETVFGRLPRTLVFEYQTIEQLAGYFATHHAEQLRAAAGTVPEGATPALVASPAALPAPIRAAAEDDIAIIGIAGRYPGARNLDAFWANLRDGVDSISEIPPERWDAGRYYDPSAAGFHADKARGKWGGFIDDVDKFDPLFFNISPGEAALLDPQERLFLETVWETVERAGYTRAQLSRLQTETGKGIGVFVGAMYQMYPLVAPTAVTSTVSYWSIANRVSYFFDFRGPSMAVDTACSSSTVAIHMACESIRRGDCVCAVAGGVNLSLHPNKYLSLQGAGLLGSGSISRSLGQGDGFVPGEGVGAVLLKPLSLAERDGDTIHGVIKGSRVHHNGSGNGYRMPNPNTQAESLTALFHESGIDPATIDYVEVAANGLDLADSIELAGLSKAFRAFTGTHTCPVGSVKSNIGHLEAASGISQLTKVLLQLRYEELAPTIHADPLNPNLHLESGPFYAQRTRIPWRRSEGHPRRVLINSTGAGGTNAHLILEQYEGARSSADGGAAAGAPVLIVLSARDEARLVTVARNLAAWIAARAGAEPIHLADLAYTLQVGREAMDERAAMVVSSLGELSTRLESLLSGADDAEGVYRGSANRREDGAAALFEGESGRAFVDALTRERDLARIARLWASGADIDWTPLHASATPNRIELPAYPFERRRCWITTAAVTPQLVEVELPSHDVIDTLTSIAAGMLKLGTHEIDVDRPLAFYGLDSILSTMMMEAVRERFGAAVSLAAILEFPTLRALARYVSRATALNLVTSPFAYPDELVPIHPSGSMPPSFWVHGLVGFAHVYNKLSAVLGPEYPVYGLQARGVDSQRPPFDHVETMAAHYVQCIRQVQPAGPYFLGGYSSGGVIALEIGRQLAALGETVARVFLLDTYPIDEQTTRAMEEKMDYAMRSVMTANLFLTGSQSSPAFLGVEALDGVAPDQHVTHLLKLIAARGTSRVPLDSIYRMLKGSIEVSNCTGEAFKHYAPPPYDASPVVFFQATSRFIDEGNALSLPVTELAVAGREQSWLERINSSLEIVNLPCDHFGLLEAPVVQTLCRRIAERMVPQVPPIHVHPGGVVSEAVVVGGGFAGLLAARVLADHFDRVTIFERDALPAAPAARKGTPQANHLHSLLRGGLNVLCDLFPEFDADLIAAGSVPFRAGYDLRQEDELGVWPQRDFGITQYCQSRVLLEWCVRRRVASLPTIRLEDGVHTPELLWSNSGARVLGVRVLDRDNHLRERRADLVVNATGRSHTLLRQLLERGWPAAEESRIPVDLGYSTCLFEVPDDPSRTWKGVYGYSSGAEEGTSRQGGSILPIENGQWIVTLGGRYGSYPPTTMEGFLEYARQLATPTLYDAIREARPVTGAIDHFRYPASRLRHFERLHAVPERLLHVGDVICSFDPVLGQGMSSAALQMKALAGLLLEREGRADALDGIEHPFFAKMSRVVQTPWQLAAKSHFESDDLDAAQAVEHQRFVSLATRAMQDPAVHRALVEVFQLMKVYDELQAEQDALERRAAIGDRSLGR